MVMAHIRTEKDPEGHTWRSWAADPLPMTSTLCHGCGTHIARAGHTMQEFLDTGARILWEDDRPHPYCQRCVRARS